MPTPSVSLAQVEQDLMDFLAANLPAGFTLSMVKWPNAKFITPNSQWLRATLTSPEIIDQDASGCYKEYQGAFVVDVFYPKDVGARSAITTGDLIAGSFNGVAFPYSFSIDSNVSIIGEESMWYHVQVNSIYQFGSYSGV